MENYVTRLEENIQDRGYKPASIALRAANLKSFTIPGISSFLSRLGGDHSTPSRPGVTALSVDEIGARPLGW